MIMMVNVLQPCFHWRINMGNPTKTKIINSGAMLERVANKSKPDEVPPPAHLTPQIKLMKLFVKHANDVPKC